MFSNKLAKNIIFFLKEYYVLFFIFSIGIGLIIVPFLVGNNIERFDHSGQYAAVYYLKNFFWPFASGWNSLFLSGFPQGLFYPSFFHWIVALFSFLIPIEMSYKLILSISILLFPVIVFILGSKLFKDIAKAGTVLIVVSIFYYFDIGLNDNLYSDIYYGMSSHLFSLTLFFLYLYSLFILIKDNKFYFSSVILSIIIITHIITSSAAILFSFLLLIIVFKNKKIRFNIFKHYIFAFLLSSFWIIPFIFNIGYISGGNMTSNEISSITLIIPFLLILSIFTLKIKGEYNFLFKTFSIFNIFIITIYLISKLFLINNFPIHFGRLLIYPFLILPFLLVYFLKDKIINWNKLNLLLLFCFCFYLLFLSRIPIGPLNTKILSGLDNIVKNGRVIVTGDSLNLDDRFHLTRTKLATEYNLQIVGGLFTESSSNGWFIMSLLKSWDKDSVSNFTWGYNDLSDVINLEWGSRIFGINYEYRINDKSPTAEEYDLTIKKSDQKKYDDINFKIGRVRLIDNENIMSFFSVKESPFYYQTFYKINNTGIAEVLNIKTINIKNDWNLNIKKWWTTDWLKTDDISKYNKPVLVYNKDTEDWFFPRDNKILSVIENKKDNSFIVDASEFKENVPIYIKIGYFPYWKAFNEFGEELEVYKTSPNFMLVYGSGKIIFKYVEPNYYYLLLIISGFVLLYLIIKSIYKRIFGI